MPAVDTVDQPVPESQEYINEMVAKADSQEQVPAEGLDVGREETGTDNRPDWLPEKFKSAEDMAKAYSALETKLGSKSEETPPADPQQPPSADEAQAMLSEKGLDYSKFESEFVQNGELSDGSLKELADNGLSRELVDGFVKGQQALADQARREG